uniref:Uncharacterized protein n=1 Tax=Oryza meridionalis TaxID=40149 RepID=A0A0E0CCB2_9ORYZ
MGIRRKYGAAAALGEGVGLSVVRTPPAATTIWRYPRAAAEYQTAILAVEVLGSISSEPTLLEPEADVDDSTALVGNMNDSPLEIGEVAMV